MLSLETNQVRDRLQQSDMPRQRFPVSIRLHVETDSDVSEEGFALGPAAHSQDARLPSDDSAEADRVASLHEKPTLSSGTPRCQTVRDPVLRGAFQKRISFG
jgi:hypothetical protein